MALVAPASPAAPLPALLPAEGWPRRLRAELGLGSLWLQAQGALAAFEGALPPPALVLHALPIFRKGGTQIHM